LSNYNPPAAFFLCRKCIERNIYHRKSLRHQRLSSFRSFTLAHYFNIRIVCQLLAFPLMPYFRPVSNLIPMSKRWGKTGFGPQRKIVYPLHLPVWPRVRTKVTLEMNCYSPLWYCKKIKFLVCYSCWHEILRQKCKINETEGQFCASYKSVVMHRQRGFTPLETKIPNGTGKRFLTGFTLIELLVVIAIIALHKNRFWFGDEPLRWVEPLKPYFENDKMLLCPSATKPMEGGGRGGKFRAWTDGGNIGSYGINYWITYSTGGGRIDALLWKTPNAKGAAYAPMFFDCAVSGCCPLHTDQPPAYDGQIYFSHPQDIDEMRALCLNRHLKHVNITFLDFSARRAGLKELWELKWHRNWNPNNDPPPDFVTVTNDYNGWMANIFLLTCSQEYISGNYYRSDKATISTPGILSSISTRAKLAHILQPLSTNV